MVISLRLLMLSVMPKIGRFLPMRHIVFIVYPGFELLDMSGPASVFTGANRALTARGEPLCYGIELVSATGGPVASSSGVVVQTSGLDHLAGQTIDTLLIVGAERAPLLQAMRHPALRKTLPGQAGKVRRLGSVCTGAFILAALGLLDGHRVATHWDGCAPLAQAFPALNVDAQALYVEDKGCWTSAGVTTGIDMALAMVASDLNAAIAAEVAKRLVLYVRRPGHQSQFSPLLQAQAKADNPFADLIGWIHTHLDARLDVLTLSERVGLSARTFHRRFVAATGETPGRFVERARLDAARLLLTDGVSLKSVAAQVGLFPAARLNETFERRFGISPRLFRDLHAGL